MNHEIAEAKVVWVPGKSKEKKKNGEEKSTFFKTGVRVVLNDGILPHDSPIMIRKPSDIHGDQAKPGKYHGTKLFFKFKKGQIDTVTIRSSPRLDLDCIDRPITRNGLPMAQESRRNDADCQVADKLTLDKFMKTYKGFAVVTMAAAKRAIDEDAAKKAA